MESRFASLAPTLRRSDIELSTESSGPIGKASRNRKKNRFVSDIDEGAAAKLPTAHNRANFILQN